MGGRGGGRAPEHYARALRCNMAGPFQICFLRAWYVLHCYEVIKLPLSPTPFTLPTDIPECTAGLHNCTGNAICVEAVGYFRCACPANYRIDENTYASCKGIALLYISVCVEIVQGNKYVIYDQMSPLNTCISIVGGGWGGGVSYISIFTTRLCILLPPAVCHAFVDILFFTSHVHRYSHNSYLPGCLFLSPVMGTHAHAWSRVLIPKHMHMYSGALPLLTQIFVHHRRVCMYMQKFP